jgi:hypothetical protein
MTACVTVTVIPLPGIRIETCLPLSYYSPLMSKQKGLWRITGDGNDHQSLTGGLMSWIETVQRAQAELTKCDADPLREKVEAIVRGMEAVSTVALLDLLGLPKTTGNGRRIAETMRSLGFIPIKSRRLMPGGYRDTVTRGWARPVREVRRRARLGEKVGGVSVGARRDGSVEGVAS